MAKMNRCEAEVDAIRDRLYEESKLLTREERIRRSNENGQKLAVQYGFKIGRPSIQREKELIAQ